MIADDAESSNDSTEPQGEPQTEPKTEYRSIPTSERFRAYIASHWAPYPQDLPAQSPAAPYAAVRRDQLGAQFPGQRLVFPAGPLVPRSNDTDYRFRPHSAFAHLTGLGTDQEPDAALVLEPIEDPADGDPTHTAVLYFRPRAGRDVEEFYADARYGELWVGVRPSLAETEALTGLATRHLEELRDAIAKDAGDGADGTVVVRIIRDADRELTEHLDEHRPNQETREEDDEALARAASELRLVKDEYEIAQMRAAVAETLRGFDDIVRALPRAVDSPRGERVVEGVFALRAREHGNNVGYDTIAASGPHACTLHWIRNDGQVRDGELILVDAGIELDSLYTADITRTLPISGTFTDAQRAVYEAVLEAADAAFEVARPGARFRDLNTAAMQVIATKVHGWGLLPGSVEESLAPENQFHRRWMVHGTSHHLGIDVHDCAKARREMYLDGVLEPGMIFTIEPGLYFGELDLMAPEEFRGIGVRIEDNVLITADGCENLSAALPRTVPEIEAWMASLRS